jgi:carboxylesterase
MNPPATEPTAAASRLRTRRRLRRLGIGLGIFVVALAVYACGGLFALNREEARLALDLDPATGVVAGTEAHDLGPSAADGATTACLLIHGFVGSGQDFADLGERIADEGIHVRVMRLPGHGSSPREFARETPETLYASVAAERDALAGEYGRVDVVGFSMGGTLATLLAAREGMQGSSDDAGRLVLAAPYYRVTYQWYYLLPAEVWNGLIGWAAPYVYKGAGFVKVNRKADVGKWFSYATVPTRGTRALLEIGRDARSRSTLEAIDGPVLLVMSEGDDAASPRAARAAFETIGSADKRALWLTRSNHHLFWDWDREQVKSEIVAFLAAP